MSYVLLLSLKKQGGVVMSILNSSIFSIPIEDMGFRVIFGGFGTGKGMTSAIYAIYEMRNKDRFERSLLSIFDYEQRLNREFKLPPQQHVVYSDFVVVDKDKRTYDCDPNMFMLPNEKLDYQLFVPWACIHFEEFHSTMFCSYEWNSLPKAALNACSRVRKPHYLITLDLQRLKTFNVNLRDNCFEYITPISIENEFNCLNQLVKTTVYLAVFHLGEKAEEYEQTKNLDLAEEIRPLVFKGDIRKCYDTNSKDLDFFDCDKDFYFSKSDIDEFLRNNKEKVVKEVIVC